MKTRKIAQAMTALTLTAAMFTGCSGTNSSITVISREDGSGTRDAFTELMGILVDDNVSRPFNIATNEDISELAADFVDYILSADGQAIIEEEGYISVSDRCGGLSIFPKRHLVLANGADHYNSNDLYWLSRIIHAESGGESFIGKCAVGNVVLNRVASSQFPGNIKDVIFDKKYGVQFTPAANGTIYNTPSEESVLAAKACLEGFSKSNSILYFLNPRIAENYWIINNRKYMFTIGNHDFYA